MKFFIDTANLDQITEAQNLGILDGVTTNPSLMAKEGISGHSNIINHYNTLSSLYDNNIYLKDREKIVEKAIKDSKPTCLLYTSPSPRD